MPNEYSINFIGEFLGLVFIVSIISICRPKTLNDAVVYMFALLSSCSVYSFERANIDMYLFMFVSVACFLFNKDRKLTALSIVLIYISALIKFYPIVALGLTAMLRPIVFLGTLIVTAILTALFVGIYHRELYLVFSNLPYSNPLHEVTGGGNFFEIMEHLALKVVPGRASALHAIRLILYVGATLSVFSASFFYAKRIAVFQNPPLATDRVLFIVGGLIVIGTFFAGQNAPYRAIWLIMVMPYLMNARLNSDQPAVRRLASYVLYLIPVLMWFPFFRDAVDFIVGGTRAGDVLTFAVREPLWWAMIFGLTTLMWLQFRSAPLVLWVKNHQFGRFAHENR
jgi:hypothetical protein